MDQILRLRTWIEQHRDVWLDLLRIYMGFALLAKAIAFMQHMSAFIETMPIKDGAFAPALLAHYIVVAHAAGGIMLIFGVLTRIAAAVNIPVLLGAVFFVHWHEGLFQPQQTLELALLVLFILSLITVVGGGPLSVDERLKKHEHDIPTVPRHHHV
ncbi:DoxX family protein [Pendulispora rubella]|uniref:DoxX family protein n=1 Tax=Pendulispora rubella TaxID=2741070 RepID=A0ABZ2LKV2_9BACT